MKNESFNLRKVFLTTGTLIISLALIAGCGGGGGGNIAAPGGSQISDDGGDDGMPSLQVLMAAEPEDDALTARSAGAVVSSAAEASSSFPGRIADDAFDGDDSTFWTGGIATSTWTLSYTFPAATPLTYVSLVFHSKNYVPTSTTLDVSIDGINWTNLGSVSAPDLNPSFTFAQSSVTYLRLSMSGAPLKGAPSVREINWLQPAYNTGIFSLPNLKSISYFSSWMIDGNESTYWIGTPGVGAWDVYYCFAAPRYTELVSMKYHSLSYVPQSATLYYSDDGVTWSPSGNFSPGLRAWAHLGRTTSCVRIAMTGNPVRNFPVVSEIYFDIQPGPASVDSINAYFSAPQAGDGNMATWWTGSDSISSWDFYYALSDVETVDSVTIHWTSNRTVPSTTALYTSTDGETWTYQADFPYTLDAALSPGADAKYLKFSMTGTPAFGKPAIREIDVASTFLSPISNISVGSNHSCIVYRTGNIKCWGRNNYGQLGDRTTTDSNIPVSVVGINNAVSVYASDSSKTCAILSTGEMKCWGLMPLGDNYINPADSLVPLSAWNVSSATTASLGSSHFCVVDSGVSKCWGNNDYLQLGNGLSIPAMVPVNAWGSANSIAVSTGGEHTCALISGGGVRCWGLGEYGQLGDGQTCSNYGNPNYVVTNAIAISSGSYHSCAVLSSGSIKCWGRNTYGQLGNGTNTNALWPVSVSGITNAVSITAGSAHTCALLSNGSIKCFGYNDSGQLGTGTTNLVYWPSFGSVIGITNAISISAKGNTTCALLDTGDVKCWGNYLYPGVNSLVPVSMEGL